MTEHTNPTTEEALPCFVQAEAAGGPCGREAVMGVYSLNFCRYHGEEARLGALMEEHHAAEMFFERFRSPLVPEPGSAIAGALNAALDHLYAELPTGDEYWRALLLAYTEVPSDVRERVRNWQRDEQEGYETVVDRLLDTLRVLDKLMRIAHEEGEGWLVEDLGQKRQAIAAEAAVALAGLGEHADNPTR